MAEAKKLTELIKNKGEFSYSFEVTPDVTEEEIDKLEADPVFYSVTWHAKSHQCRDMNIDPLITASFLRSKQKHVLLHLSCDMMKAEYLSRLLITLQEKSICNLFLVLGEGYDPSTSDFKNTSEMIKFIREKTGTYFCIGIAGFPGCDEEKLLQIKEKVAIGADFIMTQAFFDASAFKKITERCEKLQIKVPIIPGVFPFETFKQLSNFMNLCKIKVSENLLDAVKDKEKTDKPCIEIIKLLIQELQSTCNVTHFHFFTLNKLQNVYNLIEQIK